MGPARRTAIRACWVVTFEGRRYRLLRDGVFVIKGDRIVHVGPSAEPWPRRRDHRRARARADARTHLHPRPHRVVPLDRSFIEDRGSPQFWWSGLCESLPVRGAAQDEEGA